LRRAAYFLKNANQPFDHHPPGNNIPVIKDDKGLQIILPTTSHDNSKQNLNTNTAPNNKTNM
jgi:hypothetical protein